MSNVVITPKKLGGSVLPPPSKSDAHRAIICAALSKGVSIIEPVSLSNDMKATIGAIRAIGAKAELRGETLLIGGRNTLSNIDSKVNCLESGSTLRFMIPVAAVSGSEVTFEGEGRLPERPIGPYLECLPKAGVACKTEGGLPLTISGKLRPGVFELPGNISSQFITGLLLALPLLDGDSRIVLTTPLESSAYVDMTIETMKKFGVNIETKENCYFVKGNQKYTKCIYTTEADWSQAAFLLALGALCGNDEGVNCKGLNLKSHQGDRKIVDILKNFGANISFDGGVTAKPSQLHGCEIDACEIPDLVPVLAAIGALSEGTTIIKNAARLRIKESDRLHAITVGLSALGADIKETSDGLIINGKSELRGGVADGFNDHRIVMALSVAATRCKNKVTIKGSECINKSYPAFFNDCNSLGGAFNVIDDRSEY